MGGIEQHLVEAQNGSMMGFLFIGERLFVDFVNTQVMTASGLKDLIATERDWLDWLQQAKVITSAQKAKLSAHFAKAPNAEKGLAEVRAFRRQLRRMAVAIGRGELPGPAVLKTINNYLQLPVKTTQVRRAGSQYVAETNMAFDQASHLLQPIAESVSRFLCEEELGRLRKCGHESCVLYYFDTSKNDARRWCSMKVCGNRAKVSAYYRRTH